MPMPSRTPLSPLWTPISESSPGVKVAIKCSLSFPKLDEHHFCDILKYIDCIGVYIYWLMSSINLDDIWYPAYQLTSSHQSYLWFQAESMSKFSLFISVALLLASFSAYVFGETDPYAWNGISKNRRYLTNSDFEVVHIPKFRAAERKDRGRSKYGGRRLRCSIINFCIF